MRRLRILAPDPLTIVAAALLVFSFPPWNQAYLIWFALVPWFAAIRRAPDRRRAVLQGVWLSFFMSVGGFYWVATVLNEFGELPWPFALLGLCLYALGGQPQFLVFAGLLKHLELKWPKLLRSGLFLALLYTGVDWLLPKLFVDTLGHSMYQAHRLRQVADIGGASLITFIIFAVNDGIWKAAFTLRVPRPPFILNRVLLLPLLLVAAALGYGGWREEQIHRLMAQPTSKTRFGVIQPNIGDIDKLAVISGLRAASEKVLDTLFEMSEQALQLSPKPEVLVWPETSYPSSFRTPRTATELAHDQRIERFVRSAGVPLLFGGYDMLGKKDFNAFFFLSPEATKTGLAPGEPPNDLQVYRKNILLLFGEYIPGADSFDFIKNAFPRVGNFGRGIGPDVVTVKNIPIGPVICYEALFTNYVIGAARKGARMILNITNDSWFGPHGEPILHLSLTTFRSIETRLPQLRATNTGISTLIEPDGEITHASEIDKPAIVNVEVGVIEPVWTLIKAWGDWFGLACLALAALAWVAAWRGMWRLGHPSKP